MAGKKVFRILATVTLLWLVILLYMGMNLYQLVEESQKTALKLATVMRESEFLRKENIELRKDMNIRKIRALHDDLENSKKTLFSQEYENKDLPNESHEEQGNNKIKDIIDSKCRTPSIKYERTRRKVEDDVREMRYSVISKCEELKATLGDAIFVDKLNKFQDHVLQLSAVTMNDLEELRDSDGMKEFRDNAHLLLTQEVQNRIYNLQNPKDCKNARRLVCSLNKGCGYGCQIHHIIYCMIVAYASNRTMVINSLGWRYSHKGWEGTFLPVSDSCRKVGFGRVYWGKPYNTDAMIAHLPIIDSIFPRPPQLPQAVPRDLVNKILRFHEAPFLWWVGQICKFLFRYQPAIVERLEKLKTGLDFKSPIVGIHIRRTDKIGVEASHHSIDEYMKWVKIYYDKLEIRMKVDARRVFLASDDKNALAEAQEKYPNYHFVSDNTASKHAALEKRYSEASLHGIVTDIHLLSEVDYLVCTFSSQVCRLAYEMMNSKHVDASRMFKSLDDIYYFGGQHEHRVKAIYPHQATSPLEIDLEMGDELSIAGNHWDGYSKGFSPRLGREGLFPSYKVEEVVNVADFPIY